jgi:Tfp pilus assembly protein PilF
VTEARNPGADAERRLGVAAAQRAQFDAAIGHFRAALGSDPDNAELLNELGTATLAAGRPADAADTFRRAIARRADFAPAHFNLGAALESQGMAAEAVQSFRLCVRLAPGAEAAHVRLGMSLLQLGQPAEAEACFQRALQLTPQYPTLIHDSLGLAYERQGRIEDAIAAYRRAMQLDPGFAEAHNNLGAILLSAGRFDEARVAFRRFAELRCAAVPPGGVARMPPQKERHDREQLDYLLSGAIEPAATERIRAATGAKFNRLPGVLHIEGGARSAGLAIDPANDSAAIEARWRGAEPKIVVVDNLLTPDALDALRRFCWGSTIWGKIYDGGYLGTFPDYGFLSPLLMQISDELVRKFPGIFADHALKQCWAFKYDSALHGIGIHADFAAVNVNFWITPDDANLDPEHGGLVIYDMPAPLDWDFRKYNKDERGIADFLARSGAKSVTVPYRANRAVIFDSDLFHATDRIAFREGYRNRRINVTLLYGDRQLAAAAP